MSFFIRRIFGAAAPKTGLSAAIPRKRQRRSACGGTAGFPISKYTKWICDQSRALSLNAQARSDWEENAERKLYT
jgi:hypothetical protein